MTAAPATLVARTRLYADRPGCPTRHHNTVGAYRMGCRCPESTEARRLSAKRRREGRATPGRIDATGTARRIQALMLAGHRAADIAAELSSDPETIREVSRGARLLVYRVTAEAVRALAHRWADKQGASSITAARARAAGFVSLAAWDDIDDPAAVPSLGDSGAEAVVDEVAVQRVLDGKAAFAGLNEPEKALAVNRLRAAGVSRNTTAVRLRIGSLTVDKFTAADPLAA